MLLNKVDLLPHLSFDVERCVANARRVHPAIEVIEISATSGQGMADWLAWIERGARAARDRRHAREGAERAPAAGPAPAAHGAPAAPAAQGA